MNVYCKGLRLVLELSVLSLLVCGCINSDEKPEARQKFLSSDGKSIELNFSRHTLTWPDGKTVSLVECSDPEYTCLHAGHDFALAFPKQCGQDLVSHVEHARFSSNTIIALHNDAWVVFDRSPHLMFHYSAPVGIIGIYVPRSKDFDFRNLLQRSQVNLESADYDEYKIVGNKHFAACN
jgi:hypothetical protein